MSDGVNGSKEAAVELLAGQQGRVVHEITGIVDAMARDPYHAGMVEVVIVGTAAATAGIPVRHRLVVPAPVAMGYMVGSLISLQVS